MAITATIRARIEPRCKQMEKRGKALSKIKKVIRKFVTKERLEAKYKDHKLICYYKGRRECHIESAWLLIYKFRPRHIGKKCAIFLD